MVEGEAEWKIEKNSASYLFNGSNKAPLEAILTFFKHCYIKKLKLPLIHDVMSDLLATFRASAKTFFRQPI